MLRVRLVVSAISLALALAGPTFGQPASPPAAKAARLPKQQDLYVSATQGYHSFRIPAIVVSNKGTVLAFACARKNSLSDFGDIDVVLRRSLDGGKTWTPMQLVADNGPYVAGNPAPVVDRQTGAIWLTYCQSDKDEKAIKEGRGQRTVWVTSSQDDGATWSKPVEITDAVKKKHWRCYATGPCHGIQLDGGRLLIPCDHSDHEYGGHYFCSHVIYSDDHGKTWKLGGIVRNGMNECVALETVDGRVCLNMRCYQGKSRRAVAWSSDGGETFGEAALDDALIEPVCQASMIRFSDAKRGDKNRVLFSNPADAKRRVRMTIRLSDDECKTWPVAKVLHEGPSAYSDLCVLPDKTICCLYESGAKNPYERLTLARFGLDWLTDGSDTVERK
ncbi:MAG: exo-alpha-sialidase [Phycisphaerae bacterium]|nr:exo-alpha-sialidase [Phycisphaerae bacterium]